jgi:hypothetical protein
MSSSEPCDGSSTKGKPTCLGGTRSPEAFRTALEQRIRRAAQGGNIARFRQLLVFERFLARAFRYYGERVTLKGGLVREFRLERARTTRTWIYV